MDICDTIDGIFSDEQTPVNDTGCLALVARALDEFAPTALWLADKSGQLLAVHSIDSRGAGPALTKAVQTLATQLPQDTFDCSS